MQQGLRLKNLKYFKGLRNYEENNSVNTDQVYSCQNARFKNYVISSRKGRETLGDVLTGGTKFRGLYEYEYLTTSDGSVEKRLLGVYNKIFRQYNESTLVWDSISTTWPDMADAYTDGVEYNNKMYFVNPMDTSGSPTTYSPAFLTGGSDATRVVGDWADVTDGSFELTIDGSTVTVTGVDFSNVTSMDEVANLIQTAIRAVTGSNETVEWSIDHFTITSADTTATSSITVTSAAGAGTDISGAGSTTFLDAETGRGTVTNAVGIYPGVGKIEDTTFSVVPNSPRGTAIESWAERLWVIGDYTSPNAVIASRASIASSPDNIEDWLNGTILELLGKGGRCTAIRVLNNELYIWKEDGIWYNTVDRLAAGVTQFIELARTGGAINQKSTIQVENDVWFITPSLEVRSLGLERNLGSNPRTRELTSIIQRTMDLLDEDQSNANMSYHKRIVKINLKTKGSPTNNLIIIFDYDTGAWGVDIGPSVELSTVWSDKLVYAEDSGAGQVYLDDTGYNSSGAAFVFDYKTPFMDDNRPDTSKRARYIYIRGLQSYDQEITIRLYRDGNYETYSEYVIESPRARGVSITSNVNDGQWGQRQWGDQQWGGDAEADTDIPMYRIQAFVESDWLISIDRRSNMFALGANAVINDSKVIIEQMGLKVIDDNENYKRSNQ